MAANCIISQPAAQPAPGSRRCLICSTSFVSAGRHERICPRCKESETWLAGVMEHSLHAQDGRTAAGDRE